MSDDVEARKKAAEKGWIRQPQHERPRQMGVIARKACKDFGPVTAPNAE